MRIIIDTETQAGTPVVSTGAPSNLSAPASVDGGSAPGSTDSVTAAASPSDGILTINAGPPAASLIAAIAAAGGTTANAPAGIDAGPAPPA